MIRKRRFDRFARDVVTRTPLLKMIGLLAALWLVFAAGLYGAGRGVAGAGRPRPSRRA